MSRTNFVKVSNLPPYLQTAVKIHEAFSTCGVIQVCLVWISNFLFVRNNFKDITAVDPTTVIISYSSRSGADYAEFALNGVTIGGFLHFNER